jgi:hypothetical protein
MRLHVSIRTRKREQEILRNAFELGRDFERERYHRRAS